MNVSLTPTLEEYVRRKVESGLYNTASEVVREALRNFMNQELSAKNAVVHSGTSWRWKCQ